MPRLPFAHPAVESGSEQIEGIANGKNRFLLRETIERGLEGELVIEKANQIPRGGDRRKQMLRVRPAGFSNVQHEIHVAMPIPRAFWPHVALARRPGQAWTDGDRCRRDCLTIVHSPLRDAQQIQPVFAVAERLPEPLQMFSRNPPA